MDMCGRSLLYLEFGAPIYLYGMARSLSERCDADGWLPYRSIYMADLYG